MTARGTNSGCPPWGPGASAATISSRWYADPPRGLGGRESLSAEPFGSGMCVMSAPWFQPQPQPRPVGATAAAAPKLSSPTKASQDPTHPFPFNSSVLLYLTWVS